MKKTVIVTTSWDDGHKLDLKLARVLKRNNIKGTFYISPRNREFKREELLSDKEILEISNDFEIGAHTMTHPRLVRIDAKEAATEITDSKEYLKNLTNKNISSFAYPGGAYNEKTVELVKEAGFYYARTVKQYEFKPIENFLEASTTLEAYRISILTFPIDSLKILKFLNYNLLGFIKSLHWEYLAKKAFDYLLENGGIYHLWGHSWVIDRGRYWETLDRVLSYIGGRDNVDYCTNFETYKLINENTSRN